MATEPTNTELLAKIDALSAIVEKQLKLIGQTGQKLIEMQIRDTRAQIRGPGDTSASTSMSTSTLNAPSSSSLVAADPSDFATNDDLVQLVGELQGQLDELEERLVRRTFNIQLDSPQGLIAPLLNKEGDIPDNEKFPKTVDEFAKLLKREIIQYCVFYDVIVPGGGAEGGEGRASASAESAKLITEEVLDAYSQEEADEMHDELARFLGLRFRKGKSVW